MMKAIIEQGDVSVLVDGKAVTGGIDTIIVFNHQSSCNMRRKCVVSLNEALHTLFFIIIFSPDMYLDFVGCIQLHKIQNLGVVTELLYAAGKYLGIRRVKKGELIWVHGDTYLVCSDKIPQGLKDVLEMGLPGIGTDGMGGKGDKIGGNPEKQKIMSDIKCKHIFQAGKIILYGGDKTVTAIGF